MPITSRSRLSTASNSPYQHRGIPLWGGHCRPGAYQTIGLAADRAVILADGRFTRSSVGERRDVVFVLFVF